MLATGANHLLLERYPSYPRQKEKVSRLRADPLCLPKTWRNDNNNKTVRSFVSEETEAASAEST